MGQKINPVALRLQQNRTFDSAWYDHQYTNTFRTEQNIRKALISFFQILSQTIPNQSLGRVFFQKSHKKTIVTFFFFKSNDRRKRKRNRFFFKFSNMNYTQTQQEKNHFSTLKSSSFNSFNNPNIEILSYDKINQNISTAYTNMVSNPFDLSKPQTKQTTQTESEQIVSRHNISVRYKNFINLAFYSLVYTAFLRNNSKRSVANFDSNIMTRLHYMLALHKAPLASVTKPTKSQNGLTLPEKNKGTIMHPFLRIFEQSLSAFSNSNLFLRPVLCRELNQSAHFLAGQVVQILEKNQRKKKMPGHLIKKLLTEDTSTGIRIMCSGRLAGAEMARKFFLKKGKTSLNVFSQKIDFAQSIAHTKYGIIGVKVWISFLK